MHYYWGITGASFPDIAGVAFAGVAENFGGIFFFVGRRTTRERRERGDFPLLHFLEHFFALFSTRLLLRLLLFTKPIFLYFPYFFPVDKRDVVNRFQITMERRTRTLLYCTHFRKMMMTIYTRTVLALALYSARGPIFRSSLHGA